MAGILKVDKYQDFNGNDIMTSDGNGTITMPSGIISGQNYPAFFAPGNGTATSTSEGYTKITNLATVFDTDNAFSNGTFTIPANKSGKYLIMGSQRWDTDNDGQRQLVIYKNGSIERTLTTSAGDTKSNQIQSGLTFEDLSAGDYIEMYVYQNSGGTLSFRTDKPQDVFFGAFRIGA